MTEALWGFLGAIVGGGLVGVFSIWQTRISNRAAAERQTEAFNQQTKQQREMFEYQSKENEKAFQREIINQRIDAYKTILSNLYEIIFSIHGEALKTEDKDAAKKYRKEFWDRLLQLSKDLPIHCIFLDKKISEEYESLLRRIVKEKESSKISETISSFLNKLIETIRNEIGRLSGIQSES